MADLQVLKEQLKNLEQEHEKLQQKKQALLKQMKTGHKKIQSLIEFSDQEIAKAAKEPNPDRRARIIRLNELRKQAAHANLEMLEAVASMDPTKKPSPQVVSQIEMLALKVQYITMEYNLTNYHPIMVMLEEAVEGKAPAADAAPAGKTATGPLQQRPSGPLAGARQPGPAAPGAARPGAPGAAGPRPGVPQRPGAAPGGPRPLPAPGGATGPLAARAAAAAPRPATGPLARPMPGGSGPLAARAATGRLNNDAETLEALKLAATDANVKPKLMDLMNRVRDLEFSLQPLRGETTGELSVGIEAAAQHIRQLSGKVYYISRALSSLGPLGEKIPFVWDAPDPAVEKLLSTIVDEPEATATVGEVAPAQQQQGSLADRLKSLFKS